MPTKRAEELLELAREANHLAYQAMRFELMAEILGMRNAVADARVAATQFRCAEGRLRYHAERA